MIYDNIIVVGATGLVGIEFVKLISNQDKYNLILISSNIAIHFYFITKIYKNFESTKCFNEFLC